MSPGRAGTIGAPRHVERGEIVVRAARKVIALVADAQPRWSGSASASAKAAHPPANVAAFHARESVRIAQRYATGLRVFRSPLGRAEGHGGTTRASSNSLGRRAGRVEKGRTRPA